MFINIKSFILSSVIVISSFWGYGQQSDILDQYISMGIENNINLKQEELQVAQSVEALRQAKGMFLPEISLNASYTKAQGGRNFMIPVGDLINPIYQNLNDLSGQREFPTNLSNQEIQLLPDNFHDTRIELRQPLFNSEIYHNYRAKRSLISMNESKKQAYEKELVKQIKVAYFEYLQAHAVMNIYLNTQKLLEELLRVNQVLVNNHKATIDAVYRAAYEISDIKSKIAASRKQIDLAGSFFNFLLNRELNQSIEIDSGLVIPNEITSSIEYFQENAIDGRNELDQINHAMETQEHFLNLRKGQKLPNISLGAQAGYQGFGYDFDKNQDYALLSLNLEIPLFAGFQKNSAVQQSKIQLQQLKLEQQNLENQIRLEVIEAYRNLEAARASFSAEKAAARSAFKNFEIINRKYRENLVLLVEYLDARTKFTNSQASLAVAQYLVMIRTAELEWASSL